MEHYKIFEKSVNIVKFKEWLTELKAKTGDDRVALFMDQLSTHTSDQVKDYMRKLGFRFIYNAAYQCRFQPIEYCFSKVKQKFKALRSRKLVGLIQDDHVSMVH